MIKKINTKRRNNIINLGKSLMAVLALIILPSVTSLAGKTNKKSAAKKTTQPNIAVWG